MLFPHPGLARDFWNKITGEDTKWIVFSINSRCVSNNNLPAGQNIFISPFYLSPAYCQNPSAYQPYLGDRLNYKSGCSLVYTYPDDYIAFPIASADAKAMERCQIIRTVTDTYLHSSSPFDHAIVGDGGTYIYHRDTIPLVDLLNKGEDTIFSTVPGTYFIYSLRPAIEASIKTAPSEYSSVGSVQLQAEYDADALISYGPHCIPWSYIVGNGIKRFMTSSHDGSTVSFRMQDLKDARPGVNIKIEAGSASDNRNQKIIRFYPELPQAAFSHQTIAADDSLLRHITGMLVAPLSTEREETFTTLTCLKSISTRQNGIFSISESEVLFALDVSKMITGNRFSIPIPAGHCLKPGTYYVTLEGRVKGYSNNPDQAGNTFSAQSINAMCPVYTMTVSKNTLTIDNLSVSKPTCHGGTGSVSFVYIRKGFGNNGLNVYEVHEYLHGRWVKSPLFTITASGDFRQTTYTATAENVPPGPHTFAFRWYNIVDGDTALVAHTAFDGTISEPEPIIWPVSTKHISGTLLEKNGNRTTGDGQISVSLQEIENATPPYSILYSPISSNLPKQLQNGQVDITQAGKYYLTIQDKNGCGDACETEVRLLDYRLGVDIGIESAISCHQADDGVLRADLKGNIAENRLSFRWSLNGKTVSDGLRLGEIKPNTSYKLDVQHKELPNLRTSASFSMSEPPPLKLTASSIGHVDCFGQRTGRAFFTVSGGTPPLNGFWDNFTTGFKIENVPAGTYRLTVTDKNGCTARYTASIQQPDQPLRIVVDSLSHVHYNADDVLQLGYLDAHATGGTSPGRVLWLGSMAPLKNIMSGNYKLVVFDEKGCGADTTVRIESYDRLSANILKTNEVSCFNGYDAACALLIRGGNPPFEVRWSNGQTGLGLHNIPAGTYEATVTDANLCRTKAHVIFNEPAPIHLSGLRTEMPAYAGYADDSLPDSSLRNGRITAFVNGGTPPYRFNWFDKNENRSVFTDLSFLEDCHFGDYRLTVFDAKECFNAFDISLPIVMPLKATVGTLSAIGCQGEATGALQASAEGGTPPYHYAWRNLDRRDLRLPDSATLSGLPAGRYELTVTDSLGVVSTRTVPLNEPDAFRLTVQAVKAASYGGSINGIAAEKAHDGAVSVLLSGGSGLKRVYWTDTAQVELKTELMTDQGLSLLEGVSGGDYRLRVEDAHGCTGSLTVRVPQSPELSCTVRQTDSIRCHGGREAMAQAFVAGGEPPYRYSFRYEGAAAADGMAADETMADGTMADGTMADDLAADGTGGAELIFPMLWHLQAGRYTFYVTDVNNVESRFSFDIGEPVALQGQISLTPSPCHEPEEGRAEAQVQGGTPPYTYTWSYNGFGLTDTTACLTHLGTGLLEARIQDRNGCPLGLRKRIEKPEPLLVWANAMEESYDGSQYGRLNEAEADGGIYLTVQGGTPPYNYRWEQADGTADGGFTADATDGGRDTDSSGAAGGSAWCTLTTETTDRLDGRTAGTYRYTVTDAHACRFEGMARIVKTPDLISRIEQTEQIRCADEPNGGLRAVIQGGTPPYRCRWERNRQPLPQAGDELHDLPEGTYRLYVTDAKGVASTDSFRLEAPHRLTALVRCETVSGFGAADGHIGWQIAGGRAPYTVVWTGESAWLPEAAAWTSRLPDSLPSGRYRLYLTDSSGCRFEQTYTVESPDSLSLSNLRIFHCQGEKTFMRPQYVSENNGRIRAYLQGGVPPYRILWCRTADDAETADADNAAHTEGVPDADDAAHPDTVAAFEAMESGDVGLAELPAGRYTLQVTDAHGYSLNRWFEVELSTAVQVMMTEVQAIPCHGDSGVLAIQADGGKAPYTYQWFYEADEADEAGGTAHAGGQDGLRALPFSSATSLPLPAGHYKVIVTDVYGATAVDSLRFSAPAPLRLAADLLPLPAEWPAAGQADEGNGVPAGRPAGLLLPQPTGGCPPYRYEWTHGDTSHYIAYHRGQHYAVTVYDHHRCAVSQEFPFDGQAEFEARISCTQAISCHGLSDGALSVEILGGQPPYRVLWQHGDTGTLLTHLPAALYELSVMDAGGHTCIASYHLTEPEPLQLRIDPTMPRCAGHRDGWLAASVNGGSYPYRYQWQDGPQTALYQSVGAGSYQLQVTDRHGCIARDSLILSEPEPLRPQLSAYQPLCPKDGGRLHAEAIGGTPPYDFRWHHADYKGLSRHITDAPAGHYLLAVTDSLHCQADTAITIVSAPTLTWQPFDTRYLCLGQSTVLQPDFIGEAEQVIGYWTYPDGRFSDSLSVESQTDGLYRLTLLQYSQCLYHDTVRIVNLSDTISCTFWISTQILKGETVTAVDVSHPASDSSHWTLPPEAELLYAEGPYAEFHFRDTGRFDITLTSYRGLCSQSRTTHIEVLSAEGLRQTRLIGDETPFIALGAAPNPASGQTDILLNMQMETLLDYRLIEAVTGRICQGGRWQVPAGPSTRTINLPENSGLYILVLHSGNTAKHLKIIVQKQH